MKILASLSAVDQLAIGEAVERLRQAHVDGLHIDLGDGRFTPWLGGSVELVRALADRSGLTVSVHLMVERPELLVVALAKAGATRVAVHVEASPYPWRLRSIANRRGVRLGFALNPATPLSVLDQYGPAADFVSILTTEPDDEGECFLYGMEARVAEARSRLGAATELEVDGGITPRLLAPLASAGVDVAVVGRAITEATEWSDAVRAPRAPHSEGVR